MTIDLRPVAHIIGLLLTAFGAAMLFPAVLDLAAGDANWRAFLLSAVVTVATGATVALASANGMGRSLDVRQAYALTAGAWATLSIFGALPFYLGAPELHLVDALFEATSGITTTGASVIYGLDTLPLGMNLWRGMLNWIGGLGVAFVAMIFLPVMRVGGMQFFRVQGFDTFGKVMPRANDIALSLLQIYVGLTLACYLTYVAVGMTSLDAAVLSGATLATGGFAPTDLSFNKYRGAAEYAGVLFMFLAALPYIRFVQLVAGAPKPLFQDVQVRVFAGIIVAATAVTVAFRMVTAGTSLEPTLREALFNLTSIMTTTGFGSGSFTTWGAFAVYVAFLLALIGGCSGTSSSSLSVFRVIILFKAVRRAVLRILTPDRVLPIRYGGRAVDQDTVDGVSFFVSVYVVLFAALTIAMSLTGVGIEASIFAIWATITNTGYATGPLVAATGTFVDYPAAGKWLMILAMLCGRLGYLSIFVLLLPRFWRA